MPESWTKREESFDNLFDFLTPQYIAKRGGLMNAVSSGFEIPEEIESKLALWSLLYDVPFQYLVVREDMLPQESTRFFHVDVNFIFALLDGAMSIGRVFDIDYQHDAAIIESVVDRAFKKSFFVRIKLLGKPEQKSNGMGERTLSEMRSTGFLMRSVLVRGWRGLEFKAFGKNGVPLKILRLETLGNDVLIGIFDGGIERLEVAQPAEGLYFGFARKMGGGFEKCLRDLKTGALLEKTYADVSMRNVQRRVVNLKETASNIGKKLSIAEMTSAHIALEMIQNPFTGAICLSKNSEDRICVEDD